MTAEVIPLRHAIVSGGELQHGSDKVWALDLAARPGKKAHFWLRTRSGYVRICDGHSIHPFLHNGQCTLFAPGNYPKCRRCERKA